MPAVPETKTTWTNDVDALDTTNLHAYLRDPIQFLMNKPAARLRQTSGQTPADNTWTAITFEVEDWDTDPDGIGGHSTVTNTSRYTARYPGLYRLAGATVWTSNSTGSRGARWAVNGSTLNGSEISIPTVSGGVAAVPARSMLVTLAEGDYVELEGRQTSGGSLATYVGALAQSSADIVWERL